MVTATGAGSRPLGSIEAALTLANERWPLNLVAALRLEPAPDPDLLQTAFDQVQRRHPALRARIQRVGRRRAFAYGGVPAIPLDMIDPAGPEDWIGFAEAALNTSLPTASGPLLAATLLGGGGAGDLVMTFHHAIVDAASGGHVLEELLTAYAGLTEGEPPVSDMPLTAPPAVADLFPRSYRGLRLHGHRAGFVVRTMLPEIRYRLGMRRVGGPGVEVGARTQIHPIMLDAEVTSALSRAARRRRLTLASVVQAAVISAIHRRRYEGRRVTLRNFQFPDLRPYLDPEVTAEPLACYMAMTWQDVPMGAGDLWGVAGDVQDRVDASVRSGARLVATTMARPVMRTLLAARKLRMGNTAVSHTGVTALEERYGPLQVRSLHAFVSNLAVGPELSVRTGILHGRLTIDAFTLDTDMDRAEMQQLAADVVAALDAAAGG